MNHIECYEQEIADRETSVDVRVHLKTLQSMPLAEAKKAVAIYNKFISLKVRDLELLTN